MDRLEYQQSPAQKLRKASDRDEETLEAFVIVMGMSFGPVLGAALAWAGVELGVLPVRVPPGRATGFELVTAGRHYLLTFATLGFLLPVMWIMPRYLRRLRNRHAPPAPDDSPTGRETP